MITPFKGSFPITQKFGANASTYGPGGHKGVDYGTPTGTPIIAIADGAVAKQPFQGNGFGNYVTLSFGSYVCYYGHLSRFAKTGKVKQGTVIGYTGSTGWSTGPHLHLEVYKNRTLLNPDILLKSLGDDMYKGKSAKHWYDQYTHKVAVSKAWRARFDNLYARLKKLLVIK